MPPDKIIASHREMHYKEGYHVKQLLHLERVDLSASGYDGYPWQTYDEENALIAIEGLIYDKSEAETRALIREIVADYHCAGEGSRKRITEFIESCDGDYLVLIYFKKNDRVIIFNDRLGRLPAHFSVQGDVFAFSREIKFILHWIPLIEFNRIAMAEFLMQGYTLGDKTLLKRMKNMNPATLLEVTPSQDGISVSEATLLPEDFTTIDHHLSRDEAIRRCVQLFRESVSVRVRKAQEKELQIVADLSGGYDTRAVFAALCRTSAPFIACTNILITGDESHIARSLADLYGKELRVFQAHHPVDDFDVVRNITYVIDCMTDAYSAVSSYYDVLERDKLLTRPAARFMGFGGEFIRQHFGLRRHYRHLNEILEDGGYAPNLTGYVDPSSACAISKLDWRDFVKSLEYEVARLPERDDLDKVKHLYFNYYREGVGGGGENRHRLFSWTVQPLLGKNLVAFVTKDISPRLLSYRFFIDFLKLLDSRALKVGIFGSRVKLDSRLSVAMFESKTRFRELVGDGRYLRSLYKWLVRRLARRQEQKDRYRRLIGELWRIYSSSKLVHEYFDRASIQRLLEGVPSTRQVYQLLTLMTYVAQVESRFPEKISYADDESLSTTYAFSLHGSSQSMTLSHA